jgi:glycyl-tRNA synthetase
MDPESDKKHSRFHEVEHIELTLLDRHTQLLGQTTPKQMPVAKAVKDGIIDNETLGYFLARISLFLEKIGIDMRKLRFRQHMVSVFSPVLLNKSDKELTKLNRPMRW